MAGTSIHSSEPAYPAYLFSYWADSAQDPYKRPLSRAVGKRRDLQKSLGGHSEAGGKGGTEEGHGQLASPTRATRGAQLEWQWGHVLTVPLPADDRHKVPDEDSVLQCGLCGTPRKAAAASRTAQGCRENEAKWFPKLRTWESMWHSASVSCSWASYPAATRRHSWNCCCPWPSPAVEKRSDLQKSLGGHSGCVHAGIQMSLTDNCRPNNK